ncbi:MAG: AAA family ATPase [Desulfurococcaceae archaeon]
MLFYGPAGAGKTAILLTVASNLCSFHFCIYISTEETLHYDRISRAINAYDKTLFAEAYDMNTLLRVAIATSVLKPKFIFVDSVNAPMRVEARRETTTTKQSFIISLLLETVREQGGKLFASAQVRVGEDGTLEASGMKLFDYYFDTIVGVFIGEGGVRYIKPVKTGTRVDFNEIVFRITETGVSWLEGNY